MLTVESERCGALSSSSVAFLPSTECQSRGHCSNPACVSCRRQRRRSAPLKEDGVPYSEERPTPLCLSVLNCVELRDHQTFMSSSVCFSCCGGLYLTDLSLCFQSDVIHQSVFELIHTDDRALFRQQLHFAINPPGSQQDGADNSKSRLPLVVLHLRSPPITVYSFLHLPQGGSRHIVVLTRVPPCR